MKTMNRVFLMGNLGEKPAIRTSKAGKPYARLAVATERYRGPEEKSSTEWHSVFVFGDEAKRCAEWLEKGALIFVEGELNYWRTPAQPDKDKPEYHNAVHADRVRFITYGRSPERAENLDNRLSPRNHDAVAQL